MSEYAEMKATAVDHEGLGNDAPEGSVAFEMMELHRAINRIDKACAVIGEYLTPVRVERDSGESAAQATPQLMPLRSPIAGNVYEARCRIHAVAAHIEQVTRELHIN